MKQAVILAAGEGERLRPFTVNKPKVMLSTADRPVLQYIIESLAQNGIRDIVLVVGYRKESIFDWLGSGEQLNVRITYAIQQQQLGTAHALAQARTLLGEEFLVLPGDNVIEADTIREFVNIRPPAVMVTALNNPSRYGVINVQDKMVNDIIEKTERPKSNLVDTGVYAFSREIFDFTEGLLDIPDVLKQMLAHSYAIKAVETHGMWLDIVYPWDILSLNCKVIWRVPPKLGGTIEHGVSYKGRVAVGEHTRIRSNSYIIGPVIIGDNCDIGPNVCLLPATSIGDNVIIEPFTEIKNSVINSGTSIGPGCIIENSIIDKGCRIKSGFSACSSQTELRVNGEHHKTDVGAMLGEGCSLGNNVTAQPGTIVGNYCQVQSLKLISGILPDKSLVL